MYNFSLSLTKQKEKNAKKLSGLSLVSLYNSSETVQVDMPSTIQVLKSVKTQLRYLPHQQTVLEGKKQTIGNNIKLTWCIEHLRFCND